MHLRQKLGIPQNRSVNVENHADILLASRANPCLNKPMNEPNQDHS